MEIDKVLEETQGHHGGAAQPKDLEGSLGLDSLDFIELSIGIEERFGFVIDEAQDLEAHFQSLGTLVEYIRSRLADRRQRKSCRRRYRRAICKIHE